MPKPTDAPLHSPLAALAALRAGHRRYLTGTAPASPAGTPAPTVAVFGCADPQPAAETLFPGVELYVVRTAGLAVGPSVLGSLEYAVDQLGVPLVVVLGHDGCGPASGTGDSQVRRTAALLLDRSALLARAVHENRCAVVGMSWRPGPGQVRPVPRVVPAPATRLPSRARPPAARPAGAPR
ncbi:carbonic anhydrase [Micromonospora sp. R77]|uniref:carbonic anhydrase n=1 Tax=Micromonospora sp. R77 TaxID=2925836 RepID=UPI001F611D26|nr:carbonic anhydrase [Micromonospora sp. R77]MCI4065172.1 carbonic anhydrase [Micromonospora sp. R77]